RPDRVRIVSNTVFNGEHDAPDVGDPGRGIAVHQHHVGELAGRDGAEVLVALHHPRGAQGGDAQDLGGRDAGVDVELQLAVEVEAGHAVRAGDDGDAGVVESLHQVLHR